MRIVLACVIAFATCRPAQPTYSPYAEPEDEAIVEARRQATAQAKAHEAENWRAEQDAAAERQRAEEQERRVRLAEAGRQQERLELAVKNPRNAQVAWSALDCWARERRAQAKAAIQEERRYAEEGGGIVDMAKLYGLQDKMRFVDKLIAAAKTHLELLKRRRLSCDDPAVRVAASCYVSADAPCDADKFDLYLEITRAETERAEAAVLAR